MKLQALLTLTLASLWVCSSSARPVFPGLVPNNSLACGMCHDGAPSSDSLNDLGLDVESKLIGLNFAWADVCPLDSDGDGFSNGIELQDPDCTWLPGNPAPGDPALVTNPSDFDSKPAGTADAADATDATDDSTATDDATDATDGSTAADGSTDGSTATDAVDSDSTATDAVDGGTTATDSSGTSGGSGSGSSGCTTSQSPTPTVPAIILFAVAMLLTVRRRLY